MAYKLYKDVLYPGWDEYIGDAEVCWFKFKTGPEQLDWLGQKWYVNKMISSAKQSVEENGGTIIRLYIERDKAPTWETRYKVAVTAHGSPYVLPWYIIVLGLFAIIAVAVSFAIIGIAAIIWSGDLPEAMKWGTYAIIGGGVLSCLFAMILIAKPGKRRQWEVAYA